MFLDKYPISSNSLDKFYHINGKQFGQQYRDHLSDYHQWSQKDHCEEWLLFPENIGSNISIDETALTNGELYTILTNKEAKGQKGVLIAMIEGTCSDDIVPILKKIPEDIREQVKEVTLDMAKSMNKIVDKCFPKAQKVIDRFHVQKLAYEAIQEIRIGHRWNAIQEETDAIQEAKLAGEKYVPDRLGNGDTIKQLLARSRYLLFKSGEKWSESQKNRAKLLFELYPDIEEAYSLTHSLRLFFSNTRDKGIAYTKLAQWYNRAEESGFKSFNVIAATIYSHYKEILNFFDNRSTNASAESFNAKLKSFRATQRGVADISFFLYRVSKIYA